MRFTITPLGSLGGRTVGQVVDDIVRYLEPRSAEPSSGVPAVPGGEGPSSYYADRGSEPGRWLGFGAGEAGLCGRVAPADFARVLAGRDPHTGARLITAQGSAGRRPTLGAGTETRRGGDGTPIYGIADVAAAMRITQGEAAAMVDAGQRVALATAFAAFAGAPAAPADPSGSYLVPRVDPSGNRWVADTELDRVEEARARGVSPAEVAAGGEPEDLFTATHAARMAGVTAQYVRTLCRRYEEHRTSTDPERPPLKRAHLVAYRGVKGHWLITRADLVAFLERRAAPAVRVGYDLTLTTEKSLGVLALLGDDSTRAAVLSAIEAGNDRGLAHLEQHASSARRKGETVGVRGWTIASFRHLTSRALDPFPHHHNVVANTAVDEHGTRRALDARGLYWSAQEASALATAEMRYRLTQVLGVRWRPGRSGGWEIDGISDEVVREFSRRRTEIDDAVAELEEAIGRRSNLDEVQAIVASTRPAKQEVDASQLVAGWWQRAREHGLTPERLAACTGHAPPDRPVDREWIFARLTDPDHGLCARSSIFTRTEVVAALVDLPVPDPAGPTQPLLASAADIDRLADEFLASEHVIPLAPQGLPPGSTLARDALFTTPEIVRVQQRILDRYRQGTNTGAATVPDGVLRSVLGSAAHLTDEQQGLVRGLCTSGHSIQCAIGRAGAGKTTTMRAAADAWAASGYRVIGTAVKGEAARHLATGAGIPTETVAWYLSRADQPSLPFDDRTVLVVDEASTISDRDLDALLTLAHDHGASVRLIGDPDQHGAIAAGGMFRHLCETATHHTPELAVTHRLVDPTERAAVDELRRGHITEALDRLEAAGRLHVTEDELDLYIGMLNRWWHAHLDGDHHPMVDRRHHTRHQLNRLARQLLRVNGELGDDEINASGDRAFAAGDRVVARMAARHLHTPADTTAYIRNGAVGTVTAVTPGRVPAADRVRVDFDGIGTIDIPRGFFDEHDGPGGRRDVGIDHAYAVTSYAVQGATYTTSTSRVDERASRAETYVDITRGRTANHLFLTRAADPLDGEHLPKVPPPPIADSVARRLRESGPERTAIELDPLAAKVTAGDALPGVPDPDATLRQRVIAAERAARMARHEPPSDLLAHLPQRSRIPHLAKQWDATVTAIAGYRARWQPATGDGPFAWAVGSVTADAKAEGARQEVITMIQKLAISTAEEGLRHHGWASVPEWARLHLEVRASLGACSIDPTQVADLYRRLHRYRHDRGLPDDEVAPTGDLTVAVLGEPPAEPGAERASYQLLARELSLALPHTRTTGRSIA